MKKIFLSISCFLLIGCTCNHWTTQDKALEGTWLALHTIDYGTTLDIADQPDKYHEMNPLLGEHPSRSEVHAYMIGTAILHPIIVNYLPRRYKILGLNVPVRTIFQSISITATGGCVANNLNIGLRMAF